MRQPRHAAGPVLLRAVARHRRAEFGPASSSAQRLDALADWLAAGCPDPDAPSPSVERAFDPRRALTGLALGALAQATGAGTSLPDPAPGSAEVRSTQTIFPPPSLNGERSLFFDYVGKKDETK